MVGVFRKNFSAGMNDPAASRRGIRKSFHLKAVASVTLAPPRRASLPRHETFPWARSERTPPRHEGNGKDITSVSPASPPRVAGRGIKPTVGNKIFFLNSQIFSRRIPGVWKSSGPFPLMILELLKMQKHLPLLCSRGGFG